jgi:hypothetical protein
LPEEPFLNEPAQETAAIVGIDLKQPRCLLNGGRKSTHLNEFASHSRFDVALDRRGDSSAIVQRRDRERFRGNVERIARTSRRLRSIGGHDASPSRPESLESTIRLDAYRVK